MASVSIFYSSSSLGFPTGLAVSPIDGYLYAAADSTSSIYKIISDTSATLFASDFSLNNTGGMAFDTAGNLYITNLGSGSIIKYTTLGIGSTLISSGLILPTGLAVSPIDGYLYCSVSQDNKIIKINTTNGSYNTYYDTDLALPAGLAFDTDGNLFVANNNTTKSILKLNTTGSTGSLTRTYTDSNISSPEGLAFGSNGLLYFSNFFAANIIELDVTGLVTSSNVYIDASSNISPGELAIDSSQYLYFYNNSSEPFGIIYRTNDPVCFNEDTKILCLNHSLEEEYIPIQNLKKGDLVKTYLHGYRKVDLIHQGVLFNNPNKWNQCMYKMEKTEENGLLEDLIVTGGHSILVDEFSESEKEKLNKNGVKEYIYKIDDKYLLFASASDHFVPLTDNKKYNYYHLTLENNGDGNQQFGIWANGVLTETTCNDYLLNHT